jgi:hypothetical protein
LCCVVLCCVVLCCVVLCCVVLCCVVLCCVELYVCARVRALSRQCKRRPLTAACVPAGWHACVPAGWHACVCRVLMPSPLWVPPQARELFLHPEVTDPETLECKYAEPDEDKCVELSP